ncbi:hypothetical protein A8C56_06815 [Niabella ginsenosidivorans]|uniref:D-alanyl-D-alanine dipeptidase n=1 Tax=Niabella ginsenosidivorans TaxID=1176587 RepID=A0A1A9HZB7_9BACT|nr:M15 family metallopeptidase [Niabella ginsenosidivorans]ANH80726.1 hypothetical protein A8C56_06815 [Niabella ginsenosidivorans]
MQFYKISYIIILHLVIAKATIAQQYPFKIISTQKEYRQSVKKQADNRMVELKTQIPNLVYELHYATTDNFMHRLMYPAGTKTTFLRQPAVAALQKVQSVLNRQGLGLKIFDAYRPFSVTKKFWELIKDERYVANPASGSNHNRGTAVDLTIINLKTGRELPMGTGFDNFTDTAHHTFTHLPETVLKNRIYLKNLMEQNGFKALNTEWWHYTYQGMRNYDVSDLSFKQLTKNITR